MRSRSQEMSLGPGVATLCGCALMLSCLASCRQGDAFGRRVPVERRDVAVVLKMKGYPQTTTWVPVTSPITAQVKEVLCEQGKPVQEGQVLVTFQEVPASDVLLRQAWVPSVLAPVSGVVNGLSVTPGAIVFGQGEVGPPSVILSLTQEAPALLRVPILASDIQKIRPGMPVRLRLSDGSEEASSIADVVESGPERFLEIHPRTGEAWKTEPWIEVDIQVACEKAGLVVPVQAIDIEEGKAFVRRARAGKESRVEIQTGINDSRWVVVQDGLQEGDWVRVRPGG